MFDERQEKFNDLAESMYNAYVNMRQSIEKIEDARLYYSDTTYLTNEFKQGFIIGLKTLSSMLFIL